jgi:diguanylate cyclase (GGDEF)-like protein
LEPFTLSVTVAISTLVMTITASMLYLFSNKRNDSYLLDWSFSSVCFLIYGIIAVFLLNGSLDGVLVPLVPNTFFLVGHAAILSCVSRLTGKGPAWGFVSVTALGSIIFHSVPAVTESFIVRAYVIYPFLIAIYAAATLFLWNDRKSPYSRAHIPLAIIFILFILQTFLRSFIAVAEEIAMEFLGNDIIQTSGTLAIIVLFFSLTVCFALTVSWRKEIDLRKEAITDHLTGWLNRMSLELIATSALNECKRRNSQAAFILIDIDKFKSINDRFGHAVGDMAIQQVCQAASAELRNYDKCFRLGGEEFLIIVSDTTPANAEQLSDRIRKSIESQQLVIEDKSFEVTVSVGLALSQPKMSWEMVLENADKALYLAKKRGRNQVAKHDIINSTAAY